ncbi:MAG: dTMP kinase [Candidatus Eremiobacteraeota bacterium]|nr:dTMP kinase [Candidatus Eremiobacteraeota bacterium]
MALASESPPSAPDAPRLIHSNASVFIVIEGIEGSGKSTLIAALAHALRGDGHDVLMTREPGGTPLGDAVREIFLDRALPIAPMTEALLVNAARAQHVSDVIRPALAVGRLVICDRFTDSTLAYQGYGRGLELEPLRAVCKIAVGDVEPNLTLLLDTPVSVARDRLRTRGVATDRIEREDDAFHERVRRGFLELAESSPRHRAIDGRLSEKQIFDESLNAVRAAVGARVS